MELSTLAILTSIPLRCMQQFWAIHIFSLTKNLATDIYQKENCPF